MGSGTTAISALKTERNFVGFEINPDYIKLSERRAESFMPQNRLLFTM